MTIDAPSGNCVAITAHDSTNFSEGVCRSIYVGTSGDISLLTKAGQSVTFSNVPVGVLPVRAKRVNSTNTTASNMIALY